MLKTVITIVVSIVLSWLAVKGYASQLTAVSATRKKGPIEFSTVERAMMTAVSSVVFILLMISSNIRILAVILGVALSVIMVLANTYLRSNGIKLLPSFFLLWVATVISTSTYAHFTSKDTLGTVYIVLQIICLVLLLVGAAVSNTKKFYEEQKEENEEADKTKVALRLARGERADEDNDIDGVEMILNKIIKVLPIVIMILVTVLVLLFLEAKFDFLPPYNL